MKGKTVWNNNDASRRMYGNNDVTHVARFSDNESIKLGQPLAVSDSIEFGTAASSLNCPCMRSVYSSICPM